MGVGFDFLWIFSSGESSRRSIFCFTSRFVSFSAIFAILASAILNTFLCFKTYFKYENPYKKIAIIDGFSVNYSSFKNFSYPLFFINAPSKNSKKWFKTFW